jgi:hypothetical protein
MTPHGITGPERVKIVVAVACEEQLLVLAVTTTFQAVRNSYKVF